MSFRRSALALFSVTFALLVNEIMTSAIFNVTAGAVNTVVAISAALLGLSASGIIAYVSPWLRAQALADDALRRWLGGFVLATFASVLVIMNLPINHADFTYAPGLGRSALLLVSYLAAIVPFVVGGLCINLILLRWADRIGALYGADLAGAALGCVAGVLLLSPLGAPRAILWATAPAALVAARHALERRPAAWRTLIFLALPFVLVETTARAVPLLRVKRFNTLGLVDNPRFQGFTAGRDALDFERWSLDAWTVIRSEAIPQQWENFRGWGLSRRYQGPVPRLRLVNYNLRYSTYVTEFDGDPGKIRDWLDADLISLHYLLGRRYARVLNVGAGGGREVLNALNHDAREITAVDISPVVVNEIMRDRLRTFSGELYFHPRVRAIADEGRSFVQRAAAQYDLIDFTIVGGTNLEKIDVLNVDDLFTLEALRTYWSRLAPGGVFSYVMYDTREDLVSTWSRQPEATVPYIPAMKTVAGLRMAFEEGRPGTRFADHVLVAGLRGVIDPSYDLVHVIASPAPFTDEERARFAARCRELGFIAFHPADGEHAGNFYQRIVEAESLPALDAALPFSVGPATDDRPFQYAFRWRSTAGALRALATNPLVSTGFVFAALALLLCFGPVLWGARPAGMDLRQHWRLLGYFAGIGSGYMLIEIAVLLKLQLYLGRPALALGVALFAFLFASGAGSRLTTRVLDGGVSRAVVAAVAAVVGYGLLFRLAWPHVLGASLALGTGWRSAIAVAAIAPLACAMGTLFPLGVRLIGDRRDFLPWAWATNGCFSVFGIFASRIIGLFWGFDRAPLLGFGAYLVTAACALGHTRVRGVRRVWILALGATLMLGRAAPCVALERNPNERIVRFLADVTVREDTTLEVREDFVVRSEGSYFKWGMLRYLPIDANARWDERFAGKWKDDTGIRVRILELTADGERVRWERGDGWGYKQLRIGPPERLAPGDYRIVLRYLVEGALGLQPDHDELYWNALGHDWQLPVEEATVRVHVPAGVPAQAIQTDAYAGGRGVSNPRRPETGLTREESGDAVGYRVTKLQPAQSLAVVVRWPKGFVTPPRMGAFARDGRLLAVPALLCLYYLVVWLSLGRAPARPSVATRYEPPEGLSPAAVRYIRNRAADGRTLAAVIAQLGTRGCIGIEPESGSYRLTRRPPDASAEKALAPEEARVLAMLFEDGPAIVIRPSRNQELDKYLLAIEGQLRPKIAGVYFTRNAAYVAIGVLVSLVAAIGMALVAEGRDTGGILFLTWWFFFCGLIWGTILLVNVLPAWRRMLRGLGGVSPLLLGTAALAMFGAVFWVLLRMAARNVSPAYSVALFALVVTNLAWAPALKRLTARGRQVLGEIEGFRLFLERVEGDRMQRVKATDPVPAAEAQFLPYAIALEVREAWGDHLADAFFMTTTMLA